MADRFTRLRKEIKRTEIECLLLNPGPSLAYLTGLHFHLMERPVVAFFTAQGRPGIVLPALEMAKLAEIPLKFEVFPYGDDPATWPSAFSKALCSLNLSGATLAIEPMRLRVLELRYLEQAGKNLSFVDGSNLLSALRMCKEEDEITKMKKAAHIAQEALLHTLPLIKTGMTERQITSELMIKLYRAGSDVELPFSPIVSSGPNSANPHASPSDRKLQNGDLLLIDWGATKDGYFSDITRTFTVGDVDPELIKIGEIVMEANEAGRKYGKAGMSAGEIDIASRTVIEKAGYGEFFFHRTGHGLGMEAHEPPYIYTENDQVLEEGMTFTIEPGIYLPGRGGVRIEDDVVVTKAGLESLTDLPRQVLSLESIQ